MFVFWSKSRCRAQPLALLWLAMGACAPTPEAPPATIGIVLGSTSTHGADLRPVYDWAIESVNQAGGAGKRKLQAQYFVLSNEALNSSSAQEDLAMQMLADPNLVAVAGLFSFAMAPKFVAANLPYITPQTGDDDVFRAFHDGGYVWRTLESQSTLLWFLLASAKAQNESTGKTETTVALLTGTDSYGETFFDWFGFHATSLKLTAFSPVQYDQATQSCEGFVDRLLAQGTPDYVIAVPSGPDPLAQATCMVRTMKARGATSKLLLSDSVYGPELLTALGGDAEGLAGFASAPDPNSGFGEAFMKRTNLPLVPEFAANAFDAIALLAYGLQKAHGVGRKALDEGMRAVVQGQGPATSWDAAGMKEALRLIRNGDMPRVAGASGPLQYDHDVFTDPLATFYARWTVQQGAFVTTHYVTTASEASPNVTSRTALARGLTSLAGGTLASGSGTPNLPPLNENWALVVATSATWENYRHQADALAHYQALKANGFDDAHILLIMVDDVANAAENPRKGEIFNAKDGPNVYAQAVADYRHQALTPNQLMAVLEGKQDPALPEVLHSTANDNVYVFMVGHGGVEGPYLGMDERAATALQEENFLPPSLFASTVARMKENSQFRRMFIAVDACHSGVLTPAFDALNIPDVIVFAGAGAQESSFSANYASDLKVWTADQFSFNLLRRVQSPQLSLNDLFVQLYEGVAGSHVQVSNELHFGDANEVLLSEFVTRQAR